MQLLQDPLRNIMIASTVINNQNSIVMPGQKLRVFISDDSPIMQVRLANMISDISGVELVGQSASVQDSIREINRLRPDAVILDIRMLGGSGIDVLTEIKKFQNPPLVIMLTNYPFPQYRKRCMEAGADFFLDKSNEFQKVIDIFRSLTLLNNIK